MENREISLGVNFNNFDRILQSWYIISKSKDIKKGQAKTFEILKRKITLYRDFKGKVHALDSRCPHIGADLGLGRVIECKLQCPFHHWTVDSEGNSFNAKNEKTSRKIRIYPIKEKYGYIWIFNGPKPLFDIPSPPKNSNYSILKTPSQKIKCHPHLVTANAMDVTHFGALHGLIFTSESKVEIINDFTVKTKMQGYPTSKIFQRLIGVNKKRPIIVNSYAIGGHIAWLDIIEPYKFNVLFTTKQSNDNKCITNVFFFLPKNVNYIRALFAVHHLLHDDQKVLNTLNFMPGFAKEDVALKEFYKIVNNLNCW